MTWNVHEYLEKRPRLKWAMLVTGCMLMIAWGATTFAIVKEPPRHWDFGQLPDAPSESAYSTETPPAQPIEPRQFPALPEARPRNATGGPGGGVANSAGRAVGVDR
jgi:hypothetical protein